LQQTPLPNVAPPELPEPVVPTRRVRVDLSPRPVRTIARSTSLPPVREKVGPLTRVTTFSTSPSHSRGSPLRQGLDVPTPPRVLVPSVSHSGVPAGWGPQGVQNTNEVVRKVLASPMRPPLHTAPAVPGANTSEVVHRMLGPQPQPGGIVYLSSPLVLAPRFPFG